jgi:hypothetical protein
MNEKPGLEPGFFLLDELLRDLTSSYREDKALQVGVVLTLNPHFRSTPIDRHIAGPAVLSVSCRFRK